MVPLAGLQKQRAFSVAPSFLSFPLEWRVWWFLLAGGSGSRLPRPCGDTLFLLFDLARCCFNLFSATKFEHPREPFSPFSFLTFDFSTLGPLYILRHGRDFWRNSVFLSPLFLYLLFQPFGRTSPPSSKPPVVWTLLGPSLLPPLPRLRCPPSWFECL